MKICVLGNGILAQDFKRLDYVVINEDFRDFKIEHILDYDVIINTYDYVSNNDGVVDLKTMKKCNVDLPLLLSEFCRKRHKRYVHFSTADLYHTKGDDCTEEDFICAGDAYTASKLLGENACDKKDLIIRTKNLFNHTCNKDNALYRAIINPTPTKNIESYSWTVDVIRGTIALLRNKQYGVFNLASNGYTSQADICKELGLENIAPTTGAEREKFIKVGIRKLMEHIIPMDIMENVPKCFQKLKEELGE